MNERLETIQLITEGPASLDGSLSLKAAAQALSDLADGLDECDQLRVPPPDKTLPSPDDLAGLVLSFTEGQPAEIWVSAQRA